MPSVHWGLSGLGVPAPWCELCHVDWNTFGVTDGSMPCLAARNAHARGETAMFTSPVTRLPGPVIGSDPPTKYQTGRLRVRMTKVSSRRICGPIYFPPCLRGPKCQRHCNLVSQVARHKVRAHFDALRSEVFYSFIFRHYLLICLIGFVAFAIAIILGCSRCETPRFLFYVYSHHTGECCTQTPLRQYPP
jgi:hypothetical protein